MAELVVALHKLVQVALAGDPSALQEYDQVATAYGAESVGDHQYRFSSLALPFDVAYELGLALIVERGCRPVEDQNLRVAVEGVRPCHSLYHAFRAFSVGFSATIFQANPAIPPRRSSSLVSAM